MKRWHLTVFVLSIILAVASWLVVLHYWALLPNNIPVHFGFNGTPDAWGHKSIFNSFLIPTIQTAILAGFSFLYYKPEYSDIPTTLLLTTLPKEQKEHAFALIRTMLIMVLLFMGFIFTYVTYMINAVALNKPLGINPWFVIIILLIMFG